MHNVWLQSPQANVWGCQDQWGDLDVLVIPSTVSGVAAYQTPDERSGCPPGAGANTPLISRTFTTDADSLLIVTGHMIRNAAGRQDLHLMVDGSLVDRTLTYASSGQWEDAAVYWSGAVEA